MREKILLCMISQESLRLNHKTEGVKMNIKDKLKEFEEQVSVIKNPELRKIAFEKLMDSLSGHKRVKPSRKKKRKPSISAQAPQLIKDLDLSGGDDKPSLREFYGRYSPKSNQERNLIFCYYLHQIINHTPINVNHVFTCYRNIVGIKAPGNIRQSLKDTAHRRGWIDTSSLENITVPVTGINYLEHDIAKADSESK